MIEIREALTLDDVLLVPQYSEVRSRSDVNLSVEMPKQFKFNHPMIPANMASVCGETMAKFIADTGGLAIIHRFMSIEEQLDIALRFRELSTRQYFRHIGFSVGVQKEDYNNIKKFYNLGVRIICIDIAHGDSLMCVELCRQISESFPDILLIAGNVATGDGARRLWEAGSDVVKVNVGAGCFGAGTRILMSNGFYKNIEEIQPGDRVINKNGKAVNVIGSQSTGVKKVIKLRHNLSGPDTKVTPEHQFWVVDTNGLSGNGRGRGLANIVKSPYGRKNENWKEIGLSKKDILLFPKYIDFEMPDHFNCQIKDYTVSDNYDFGYVIGTFLGDGCSEVLANSNYGRKITWSFGKGEQYIADKLSQCLKSLFDKKPAIYYQNEVIQVVLHSKSINDFFIPFGKKINKNLPKEFWCRNKDYLSGIIDGLIDSDGHIEKSNKRTSILNTSQQVIELFNIAHFIVNGFLPHVNKIKKSVGKLKNADINNFNQSYRSDILIRGKLRLTDKYQVSKALEITQSLIEEEVFDIEVDCDTHSFIANNAIVHNSLCTTRLAAAAGVPQLTALMDVAAEKKRLQSTGTPKWNKQLAVIADGGMKQVGDVVKSLCFSDMAMSGNMFSGCTETPGKIITIDGISYKEYNGSSTHKNTHIEGVKGAVPIKGSAQDVLDTIFQGLRSGCAYQNANNLIDLQKNPKLIRITNAGLIESGPHDVKVIR